MNSVFIGENKREVWPASVWHCDSSPSNILQHRFSTFQRACEVLPSPESTSHSRQGPGSQMALLGTMGVREGSCLPLMGVDVVQISQPIDDVTEGGAGAVDKIIYISRAVKQLACPQEHCNMHNICFPSKAKCKFLPGLMTLCSSSAGRDQAPQCCQLPPSPATRFNSFLSPMLFDTLWNYCNVGSRGAVLLDWALPLLDSPQQSVETQSRAGHIAHLSWEKKS